MPSSSSPSSSVVTLDTRVVGAAIVGVGLAAFSIGYVAAAKGAGKHDDVKSSAAAAAAVTTTTASPSSVASQTNRGPSEDRTEDAFRSVEEKAEEAPIGLGASPSAIQHTDETLLCDVADLEEAARRASSSEGSSGLAARASASDDIIIKHNSTAVPNSADASRTSLISPSSRFAYACNVGSSISLNNSANPDPAAAVAAAPQLGAAQSADGSPFNTAVGFVVDHPLHQRMSALKMSMLATSQRSEGTTSVGNFSEVNIVGGVNNNIMNNATSNNTARGEGSTTPHHFHPQFSAPACTSIATPINLQLGAQHGDQLSGGGTIVSPSHASAMNPFGATSTVFVPASAGSQPQLIPARRPSGFYHSADGGILSQAAFTNHTLKKMPKWPIWRVCVTGGPCSGKSTSMPIIKAKLEACGFRVYIVPEVATLMINGGLEFSDMTREKRVNQQKVILQTIMMLEDSFYELAKGAQQPSILLCDRGTLDGSAYCSAEEFEEILSITGYTIAELRDARYDAIVHLVTTAIGATSAYTTMNNEARRESAEEAADLDRRTREKWNGHRLLGVFDNSTPFPMKCTRVVQFIKRIARIVEGGAAAPLSSTPSHIRRRRQQQQQPDSTTTAANNGQKKKAASRKKRVKVSLESTLTDEEVRQRAAAEAEAEKEGDSSEGIDQEAGEEADGNSDENDDGDSPLCHEATGAGFCPDASGEGFSTMIDGVHKRVKVKSIKPCGLPASAVETEFLTLTLRPSEGFREEKLVRQKTAGGGVVESRRTDGEECNASTLYFYVAERLDMIDAHSSTVGGPQQLHSVAANSTNDTNTSTTTHTHTHTNDTNTNTHTNTTAAAVAANDSFNPPSAKTASTVASAASSSADKSSNTTAAAATLNLSPTQTDSDSMLAGVSAESASASTLAPTTVHAVGQPLSDVLVEVSPSTIFGATGTGTLEGDNIVAGNVGHLRLSLEEFEAIRHDRSRPVMAEVRKKQFTFFANEKYFTLVQYDYPQKRIVLVAPFDCDPSDYPSCFEYEEEM